jgi:hypothetical protein
MKKKTTIYNSFHSLKFNKSFEHKILNETQQSPNFLKSFHSACLYFMNYYIVVWKPI